MLLKTSRRCNCTAECYPGQLAEQTSGSYRVSRDVWVPRTRVRAGTTMDLSMRILRGALTLSLLKILCLSALKAAPASCRRLLVYSLLLLPSPPSTVLPRLHVQHRHFRSVSAHQRFSSAAILPIHAPESSALPFIPLHRYTPSLPDPRLIGSPPSSSSAAAAAAAHSHAPWHLYQRTDPHQPEEGRYLDHPSTQAPP